MEILTIVLSALLSLGSSGSLILDKIVQGQLRSQVLNVEQQAVRIDNRPNYRAAQGKLERVRIANRGITIRPGLRIAVADLETDRVALKLAESDFDSLDGLRESLESPASGLVRLIITETDLNQALQSPEILTQLQSTLNRLLARRSGSTNISYQLSDLNLELRTGNRLQVRFKLYRPPSQAPRESNKITGTSEKRNRSRELDIALDLAFQVVDGTIVRLLEPTGTVNNRPLSSRLLKGFAEGISDRLDLNSLSADGIITRILQLEIDEDKLELVSFIRLETKRP
ncbi:MAG: DUF2993 domain-containing protein [Cyanobacteria bacterium P01_A01_bin.40]